jgi:flagellar motor switch protein FliN/FliY
MTRVLTPEELAALRADVPYVPAPRERFHVVVDAGQSDLTSEELNALRVGDVIALTRAANGPVEIVANGTTVAYGELTAIGGRAGVRVTALTRNGPDSGRSTP